MRAKAAAGLAVAIVAMLVTSAALAHGRYYGPRVRFGVYVGAPAYWYPGPFYAAPYYSPYYYPPAYPAVVSAPAQTTYVERGDANTPQDQSTGYWYFCPEAKAYYPYVKQCAGGWQKVNPTPSN